MMLLCFLGDEVESVSNVEELHEYQIDKSWRATGWEDVPIYPGQSADNQQSGDVQG